MDNPVFLLIMTAVGLYVGKLWLDDRKAARLGGVQPGTLPGATDASGKAIAIAVLGALVILAGETWGENALGLTAQQSKITWLFGAYSLVAAIIEEVIFRGFIVIDKRGKAALWAGAVGASVLFAALHPFLWTWDKDGFALTLGAKGWFSTGTVFVTSLWLYAARFAAWNPTRSLLPCFAAHGAKNLGVIVIKAAQGFMGGVW
ncbi:MAG: CPBP family intramembrane metalloprotease [Verrucomicrobia bacterium]|nr:CPBP family intramembrane metalloprotease [Verrucomicrobiota bacterium]